MYLLKILSYTGLCILLINTIIYSIGFTKRSKAYRTFTIYLLALFVIQLFGEVCASENINNHFLGTYILFIPFILLSIFFNYQFSAIKTWKQYFVKYFSPIVTVGLIIQYCITPELYFEFNSAGLLITTCTLIVYSVMYLFELISKQLSFHYITIGIFIYFLSSSLIFVSLTSIVSFNQEISAFIYNINALLFIVYQLLILWEWKQSFYLKATNQE
jgi:hypothetical protein